MYVYILYRWNHSFFSSALTLPLPLVNLTLSSAALLTSVALFLLERLWANSPAKVLLLVSNNSRSFSFVINNFLKPA